MELEVKGFLECSFLEWPGKVASVLFLPHCNLRCPFCHNPALILRPDDYQTFAVEDVLERLRRRRKWLDGVVITGGEPTLHAGLGDLCRRIQALGLGVKLETNGTRPEVLQDLVDRALVDVVAMDVKSALDADRYCAASGCATDVEAVRRSLKLLMSCGLDYEFHTTLVPGLHTAMDVEAEACEMRGARRLILQRHQAKETLDGRIAEVAPFSEEAMRSFVQLASPYVTSCAAA